MRPHNKSTLWDEYLEHPDKAQKYFNTKHKKAFCKECIRRKMTEFEVSPQEKAEFEQQGIPQIEWEQWKYNKAFSVVEALSGRSSNMQRHIKNCPYINEESRYRIMTNFELAQAAAKASKEHDVDDFPSNSGTMSPGSPLSSPPPHYGMGGPGSGGAGGAVVIGGRPRTSTQSDDDGLTSPSSGLSPKSAQYSTSSGIPQSTSPTKPSRKITLQSILNDDPDPPQRFPGSSFT
ncbi:hypothetical protein BZA77DRAFT_5753 [Pyronema omphalodes]|nr:hypothetical protein BZA77DRAFT_5753 [Pyronema omphalodes]